MPRWAFRIAIGIGRRLASGLVCRLRGVLLGEGRYVRLRDFWRRIDLLDGLCAWLDLGWFASLRTACSRLRCTFWVREAAIAALGETVVDPSLVCSICVAVAE